MYTQTVSPLGKLHDLYQALETAPSDRPIVALDFDDISREEVKGGSAGLGLAAFPGPVDSRCSYMLLARRRPGLSTCRVRAGRVGSAAAEGAASPPELEQVEPVGPALQQRHPGHQAAGAAAGEQTGRGGRDFKHAACIGVRPDRSWCWRQEDVLKELKMLLGDIDESLQALEQELQTGQREVSRSHGLALAWQAVLLSCPSSHASCCLGRVRCPTD